MGVDTGGAGDQGLMFGYACDETPELMPLPIMMAHKLCRRLCDVRRAGHARTSCVPTARARSAWNTSDGKPKRIEAVVISTQHSPDVSTEELRARSQEAHHRPDRSFEHGRFADQVSHQPDRPLRGRRTARRYRPHRPQDHRRYLRRHGPSRRRRVLRQGSDEGGPLGLLHGALHRQEPGGGRAGDARAKCSSPTPSAWPSRCR